MVYVNVKSGKKIFTRITFNVDFFIFIMNDEKMKFQLKYEKISRKRSS